MTTEAPTAGILVHFQLGDRRFGLSAAEVSQVLDGPIVTAVPGAPSEVLGLVTSRGWVVTVLDACRMMAHPGGSTDRRAVIVFSEPWRHLALAVPGTVQLAPLPLQDQREADDSAATTGGTVALGTGDLVQLVDREALVRGIEDRINPWS